MVEINFSILIVQVITFCVAVFILWKFFWGPLTDFMEQRKNHVAKNILEAQQQNDKASKLAGEYKSKLEKINQEAKSIFDKMSNEGKANKDIILKQAQEETKKMLESARVEINLEKEKASRELKNEVAGLSLLLTEKLLKQSVDKMVQGKFVKEVTDQLKNEK